MNIGRPRLEGSAASARKVVLALFWINLPWAVGLPWHLTARQSAAADLALAAALLLAGTALGAVMWASVTPWATSRTIVTVAGGSMTTVALLWWPLTTWAEPGTAPWSWLAGFAAGSVALAVPWRVGVALAVLLVAGAAAAALRSAESVLSQLVPVMVSAALVLMMMLAMVWLLRLLLAAEDARRTQARTVVLEERLRVAREIHDAVGHQMAVIALKAEVAGQFAVSDVARTRAETEAIRELTANTLIEVRRALHGDTVGDIDAQLETAGTVLASAGIAADIAAPSFRVSDQESQLLAAVVREAVTNILRHAEASRVTVSFTDSEGGRTMVIANDVQRVPGHNDPARSGTGLDGLAARCAAVGARMEVDGPSPSTFRLTVRLPPLARSDG